MNERAVPARTLTQAPQTSATLLMLPPKCHRFLAPCCLPLPSVLAFLETVRSVGSSWGRSFLPFFFKAGPVRTDLFTRLLAIVSCCLWAHEPARAHVFPSGQSRKVRFWDLAHPQVRPSMSRNGVKPRLAQGNGCSRSCRVPTRVRACKACSFLLEAFFQQDRSYMSNIFLVSQVQGYHGSFVFVDSQVHGPQGNCDSTPPA